MHTSYIEASTCKLVDFLLVFIDILCLFFVIFSLRHRMPRWKARGKAKTQALNLQVNAVLWHLLHLVNSCSSLRNMSDGAETLFIGFVWIVLFSATSVPTFVLLSAFACRVFCCLCRWGMDMVVLVACCSVVGFAYLFIYCSDVYSWPICNGIYVLMSGVTCMWSEILERRLLGNGRRFRISKGFGIYLFIVSSISV
jgi:hypothetical protein